MIHYNDGGDYLKTDSVTEGVQNGVQLVPV